MHIYAHMCSGCINYHNVPILNEDYIIMIENLSSLSKKTHSTFFLFLSNFAYLNGK